MAAVVRYRYAMHAERFERVTEAQRECLRRVYQHMTSKDIARELGVSPHTVDQRLRLAIKTLGVTNRVEAAVLLAQHEGAAGTYQPSAYQPPSFAPADTDATVGASIAGERRREHEAVRERQLVYEGFAPAPARAGRFPLPLEWGDANTLSAWQRLGWIVAIAVLSALAFGAVLSGLDALASLLRG